MAAGAKKQARSKNVPSATLQHVHITPLSVASEELSPPHPPRVETPEYAKAHHFLIYTKNAPCQVCGVTRRTLKNARRNPFGAKQLETHHAKVERSLADACDWRKVHEDYPSVYDQESFLRWVDSPENLIVVCDVHHRSVERGIHHLTVSDWNVQKYLRDGYIIAAPENDAAKVMSQDEAIMRATGLEVLADAPQPAAPDSLPA